MDDEQYRQARAAIDEPRCIYEKALQYGYFSCQYARKISLGEREALHCLDQGAHACCDAFYSRTLKKSGFALGDSSLPVHLTFNKAMKVQIGGLNGVMHLVGAMDAPEELPGTVPSQDVAHCLKLLQSAQGSYDAVNYSAIVPYIQKFSLRKRRQGDE